LASAPADRASSIGVQCSVPIATAGIDPSAIDILSTALPNPLLRFDLTRVLLPGHSIISG
jgi:hypothetical protein